MQPTGDLLFRFSDPHMRILCGFCANSEITQIRTDTKPCKFTGELLIRTLLGSDPHMWIVCESCANLVRIFELRARFDLVAKFCVRAPLVIASVDFEARMHSQLAAG